jgi:hypothetical protein
LLKKDSVILAASSLDFRSLLKEEYQDKYEEIMEEMMEDPESEKEQR